MWTGVLLLSLAAAAPSAGLTLQAPGADCATWQDCRAAAESALASGAFGLAHDLAWRALQRGPRDDAALMFLLARAQARAGRPQDALVMVRRLAERGVQTEAETHPDLERMRALPGWAEVEPLVAGAGRAPVSAPAAPAVAAPPPPAPPVSPRRTVPSPPPAPSTAPAPGTASPSVGVGAPAARVATVATVATVPGTATEDTLAFQADPFAPAGLAYDAVSRRFIVGDAHGRKLRVVAEGRDHAVDLVRAESAGFYDIRALAIDTRRGDLWVATADQAGGSGALHRIQLISGRPLQVFPLRTEADAAIDPVDLAVAGSGAVLVLTGEGRILRVRAADTAPSLVTRLTEASRPSSLALASGDGAAYVAHATGVLRVDLASGRAWPVTTAGVVVDGLRHLRAHREGVVGLQCAVDGLCRLLRLAFSRDGRTVRAATAYDVRLDASGPTALTVTGDEVAVLSTGAGEATAPAAAPAAELVVRRLRLQ